MKRLAIRWRLTLWYSGVLALVLLLFSGTVYAVMRHQLMQRIDLGLREELADVRSEIERATSADGLYEWLDRRFARHEGFDFQVTELGDKRFFASLRLADKQLPPSRLAGPEPQFESVLGGDAQRWRMVSIQADGPQGPLTVQIARSLAAFDHESAELLFTFLLTAPVTLLVATLGGYFLAGRMLRPLQTMTQAAHEITAERLSQRVAVHNPDDELGALAQTLNRMIERLERSFLEMQRFTADAAHELRTPLAVMRSEAEIALRAPRAAGEYARVLESLLEETNRLSGLADQLLFLSRQDAGLLPGQRSELPIDELVAEVARHMQLVAGEKGVTFSLDGNEATRVVGDAGQLRRVLYNLIDNAIKYTPSDGQVSVTSVQEADSVVITVSDTGIGIPPDQRLRIFDRFYRVDPARSGDAGGVGLGLAICQAIVRGCGGTISVESAQGIGTSVRVRLPLAAAN